MGFRSRRAEGWGPVQQEELEPQLIFRLPYSAIVRKSRMPGLWSDLNLNHIPKLDQIGHFVVSATTVCLGKDT